MKATSISPGSARRTATRDAVVFLHGHQLERNLVRAAAAEAAGTFVLVLAIISAAVAAALARPVAGAPYGSLAVPVAGGLGLAIAVASTGHISPWIAHPIAQTAWNSPAGGDCMDRLHAAGPGRAYARITARLRAVALAV